MPVRVLTFSSLAKGDCDISGDGIEIIRRPHPPWRRISLIRKHNPFVLAQINDVIQAHGLPSIFISTSYAVFANRQFQEKPVKTAALIAAFENFGWSAPGVTAQTRLAYLKRSIVDRRQGPSGIRSSDLVITNSEFMRSCIHRRFGKVPVQVIYPPLDLPIVSLRAPADGRLRVGFSSGSREKNLSLVLRLAGQMPDADFHVFGRAAPEREVPPNLTLHGWQADRERIFGSADIWLVPSRWPEPFGMVSVESQASGCRTLVSNRGGLQETICGLAAEAVTGFDLPDWEHAIRRMHAAPALTSLQTAQREAFMRSFTLDAFQDRVLQMVDSLLPRTSATGTGIVE